MTIKIEDLTTEDDITPGDEIHIQSTHEGRWHTGLFLSQNDSGVTVLEDSRLKFFPWSNVISVYKEIVR